MIGLNVNLVGQKLGNYEIVELIGQGGMAAVYRAVQTTLNRSVAIKVLAGVNANDDLFRHRFDREAKAVAQLSHPNIVPIHDFGSDDERSILYIVMEYVTGGNLRDLAQKTVAVEEATRIIVQVAHALDYAHSRGIIHRDIKPGNILLTDTRRPMLSDFGLAKLDTHPHFTESGLTIGTPAYMSPEQVMGEDLDRRSDVYSLAIVLYELLTGRTPFQADTPLALLHQQVYEAPQPPRKLNPRLSRKLERVLMRALRKKREDRYATAVEFAVALEKTLKGPPVSVVSLAAAQAVPGAPSPARRPDLSSLIASGKSSLYRVTERTWKQVSRVGAQALRALARAVVYTAVVVAVLGIAGILLLSVLAERTIASYQGNWSVLSANQPTTLDDARVSAEIEQYIKTNVPGFMRGKISVYFGEDESLQLIGEGPAGRLMVDARLYVFNGALQVELEGVNGLVPHVAGGIISGGVNRGLRQAFAAASVRLDRIESAAGRLIVYPRRKQSNGEPSSTTTLEPTPTSTPTVAPTVTPTLTPFPTPTPVAQATAAPTPQSAADGSPTATPASTPTPAR